MVYKCTLEHCELFGLYSFFLVFLSISVLTSQQTTVSHLNIHFCYFLYLNYCKWKRRNKLYKHGEICVCCTICSQCQYLFLVFKVFTLLSQHFVRQSHWTDSFPIQPNGTILHFAFNINTLTEPIYLNGDYIHICFHEAIHWNGGFDRIYNE